MEPGLEPLGIAQRRQIPPGAEQRLLGGVLRPVAITEDPVGEGIAAIDVLVASDANAPRSPCAAPETRSARSIGK